MASDIRRQIEKKYALKVIDEQRYSWGEIYWLQLDPDVRKKQGSVSIVIVYPGTEQKIHTHPGYEEIIFGLEGRTTHSCNGREIVLSKGKVGYISAGSQHAIINSTANPAKIMSIVYPTVPNAFKETYETVDIDLEEITHLVNLGAIAEKFALSVGLGVTVVSHEARILAEPKNLPQFCSFCIQQKCGDCILSIVNCNNEGKQLVVFRCRFGIYSIQSPIIINERLLGYLGCGYGRLALPKEEEEQMVNLYFPSRDTAVILKSYLDLKIINRNHLQSVAETLSLVSASLVHLIINSVRENQINIYKLSLAKEKHRLTELENSLNLARLNLLESQVNPHFLFNTLNTIVQSSIMEGATTAASLTYALSNILRRSLSRANSLITVEEELVYIKDYLLIQKTRFFNRFEAEINVAPEIMQTKIPFMMLVALVENAIAHGFKNIRWQGQLTISGSIEGSSVVLEVIDNGSGIPMPVLDQLESLKKPGVNGLYQGGIGLKNIMKRLDYYYGEKHSFTIGPLADHGTKATIKLPF